MMNVYFYHVLAKMHNERNFLDKYSFLKEINKNQLIKIDISHIIKIQNCLDEFISENHWQKTNIHSSYGSVYELMFNSVFFFWICRKYVILMYFLSNISTEFPQIKICESVFIYELTTLLLSATLWIYLSASCFVCILLR